MISILAIYGWVLVVFWLVANRSPAFAISVAIVGAFLLLPENYALNLPAVPTLNKNTIPALAALLATAVMVQGERLRALPAGGALSGLLPRSRAGRILLLVAVIGVIGTGLTNGDYISYGPKTLQRLGLYDIASLLGNTLFGLIAFFLARKYLARPEDHRLLLLVLARAGLLYSLLALYEVRMSPQLSNMVYGYFPHQWLQHIRAGGYRPVVFLPHGLWLANFFCVSFLACAGLWRSGEGRNRTLWLAASLWMVMVLVLSKGVGSLGIAIVLGTVVLLLPARRQILVAAALAGVVLVYPSLRGGGLIPTQSVVEIAASVDQERAGSLAYRLQNEDMLLAKANERPLFGWGGWGRNRVFDETGRDISATDGFWVMEIGTGGWIGYLGKMGLLTAPLILLALRWRKMGVTAATAGVAMALTANLVDLIPNAALSPVTWLMAGALIGRLELGRIAETDPLAAAPGEADEATRRSPYSRQRKRHPPQSAPHAEPSHG